jgi:hypothetical protein
MKIPNPKSQIPNNIEMLARILELEIWCVIEIWILGFGVS